MKTAMAAVFAAAVALRANGVFAQTSGNSPGVIVPQEIPTRRWFYGFPIIAFGELGAVMTSASLVLPDRLLATTASTVGFIAGAPTFALAGPIVHWSHDDFSKGVVSVVANIALPVLTGVVGRSIACRGDANENCAYRGFGRGFAVTALLLPVADALLLGWEEVPVDESGGMTRAPSRASTWSPAVAVTPAGGVNLGVSGTF